MSQKLEDAYKNFVEWNSKPLATRNPKTLEEFATLHKVQKAKLIDFIDSPTYYEDLQHATTDWAKSKIPELLHILYENYKLDKDPQDLKLFHQIARDEASEKQDAKNKELGTTQNIINIFNPTDEQRLQIAERIARRAI